MRRNRILLLVIATPLLMIVMFRIFIRVVNWTSENFFPDPAWNVWKTKTSPLTREQINVLCVNLGLEKDIRCNGQEVYGPDFYDVIVEAFHPEEEYGIGAKPSTYGDIEEKLGYFKVECGEVITESNVPPFGSEFKYFICNYDLRGDGVFLLGIFYKYPEETVWRITRPLGGD